MVRRPKPKITKTVKKATSVEKSSRLITGENNPEVRQWLSKLVITVIGNRYLDSFIQSIQRVVKKVEVIDAYESSQQQVDSAIKHSDYTFIDTGSVPHSVMDALKRLDDELGEIQLFYQPKDNDGVARLCYLYWKMQGGHK